MAKHTHETPACAVDITDLLNSLHSEDPATRAKAVRQICPCRLGFGVFEQLMPMVTALQKDPDPTVRAAALHVFEDAYEILSNGLPTTRRMVKNDMVATRIRSRGRDEGEPPAPRKKENPRSRARRS